MGIIYIYSDDPALLVEKPFGIRYTLKFGNPWVRVLFAVILIPVLFAWPLR